MNITPDNLLMIIGKKDVELQIMQQELLKMKGRNMDILVPFKDVFTQWECTALGKGNYKCINEGVVPNDNDFVKTTTVGFQDDYLPSKLTGPGAIVSVQAKCRMKSSLGKGRLDVGYKIGSNFYPRIQNVLWSVDQWITVTGLLDQTNPATGQQWAGEDFDTLEMYISAQNGLTDLSGELAVSSFYLEITRQ